MIFPGPAFFLKSRLVTGRLSHRIYKLSFSGSSDHLCRFTNANTEICLEGFPRSANSFAFNLFRAANPQICRYARHVHTVSQVAEAVAENIPTLLLIREPRGSIASLVKRFPNGNLEWVLKAYIAYYQEILPLAQSIVVSDFPQTTGNLNLAISALNRRYGLSFEFSNDSLDLQVHKDLQAFSDRGGGVKNLPPIRQKDHENTQRLDFPVSLLDRAEIAFEAVRSHSIC